MAKKHTYRGDAAGPMILVGAGLLIFGIWGSIDWWHEFHELGPGPWLAGLGAVALSIAIAHIALNTNLSR